MQPHRFELLLLSCSLIFTTTANAVNDHAHKPHAEHSVGAAQHTEHYITELRLDKGEKWPTDKALRDGMKNIRKATDNAMHSAHMSLGHNLSQKQAEQLVEQVDYQVRQIFAQCKLPAEADAVLHTLLADILAATQRLRETHVLDKQSIQQTRIQALLSIQNSLDLYPKYFDDRQWHTN